MQKAQPISLIMGMEISPVKAPAGSQYTFWAPRAMSTRSNSSTVFTCFKSTNGGQTATSTISSQSRSMRLEISWASTTASGTVSFIFQLPAISFLRAISPPFSIGSFGFARTLRLE